MKTTDKDQWIEKVLQSSDGIRTISAPENLSNRIFEAIDRSNPSIRISQKTKWLIAASLAFLLTLNILTYRQSNQQDAAEVAPFSYSEEYQLFSFTADI